MGGLVQRNPLEGLAHLVVGVFDLRPAANPVEGGKKLPVGAGILPAGRVKAAVLIVAGGDLIEVVDHLEGLEQRRGRPGQLDFGIDPLGRLQPILLAAGAVLGEIDHLKAVPQIPQDLFEQFAVIAQAAEAMGHHQRVRPRLERLDQAAENGFEGGADKIGAVLRANLLGMPG